MSEKDWAGNKKSTYVCLGASNHTDKEREQHDFYATDPKALELLLDLETFSKNIYEPACGQGHLSKVLENRGYIVKSTDLIDRGYGIGGVDFLKSKEKFNGDIITNPPYKFAIEFVKHSLDLIPIGNRIAMFLKIQFFESQERSEFFKKFPPKIVYVSSKRIGCAINGDFEKCNVSALCYCWFVWEKGFKGDTIIKWFNDDFTKKQKGTIEKTTIHAKPNNTSVVDVEFDELF